MSIPPEKEKEYQQLLDCFRSGQMSEADMNERMRDDFAFSRFVFQSMQCEHIPN